MVDCLPGIRAGIRDQPFHDIGRHLLHQFLGVIGHHVVYDIAGILVRQGSNDELLEFDLQIRKNIRCHILGQYPEYLHDLFLIHMLQIVREIRVIQFLHQLSEPGVLSLMQQLSDIVHAKVLVDLIVVSITDACFDLPHLFSDLAHDCRPSCPAASALPVCSVRSFQSSTRKAIDSQSLPHASVIPS